MNEHTLNLNAAECIKSVSDVGGTTYQNICNGTASFVPWGSADWVAFCVLCGIGGLFVMLIVGVIFMMIRY